MPGAGKPFEKGNQAGKGHGRPPGPSYISICRKWAEEKGWDKLINLADGKGFQEEFVENGTAHLGPDYKIQLEAMRLLFAYGFGKPSEHIDLSSSKSTFFEFLGREFSGRENGNSLSGHSSGGHHQ